MQGWRSGESVRLPPLWPGFDSRNRRYIRYIWVEFIVGSRPCIAPRVFLRVLRVSSLHKNQHSKFQFDPEIRATGLSALLLVLPSQNKVNFYLLKCSQWNMPIDGFLKTECRAGY